MDGMEKSMRAALAGACADGPISYRSYIGHVLYADGIGYYRRERPRVGRAEDRDFYTAESLGPVFARLVGAAAVELLGAERATASTFVEIGPEPHAGLLGQMPDPPFAGERRIRPGDPPTPEGPCVVFANEWLDALPFHRLVFHDGAWHERGVDSDADGNLTEVLLPEPTPEVAAVANRLPAEAAEGYQLDLPLAAEAALAELAAAPWSGLLFILDYGRTWRRLVCDCPAGTARCYRRHTMDADLLDRPGEKDITCDICWDPLERILRDARFHPVTLESQEAFLVKRAHRAAAAIVEAPGGAFSRERQTLKELTHPAHMGRRFQALWALRETAAAPAGNTTKPDHT